MLARPEWVSGGTFVPDQPTDRPGRGPCARPLAGRRLIRRSIYLLRLWHSRASDRNALATMSLRDLRDIGITRADALAETGKPFWRA